MYIYVYIYRPIMITVLISKDAQFVILHILNDSFDYVYCVQYLLNYIFIEFKSDLMY